VKLPPTKQIAAALGGAVALAIAVVTSLQLVHWTAGQVTVVSLAATAGVAFVTSVIAHFRPGTASEPVALGATFTALVGAVLALGNTFAWWTLDATQIGSIMAAVAVIVGGGTAAAARQVVTPVAPRITAPKQAAP